jgi:hypothetical protein
MQIIQKVLFEAEKRSPTEKATYTTHTATITTHKYDGTVLGNTIVVGGAYKSCVSIGIIYIDGVPVYGTLDRADSEVECSILSNLDNGDFINVLRASIQFAHRLFPTVNIFIFDDRSEIDCGSSLDTIPPRRREIPFSLAHLSLSYSGMTWYERTLNAKMMPVVTSNLTADKIRAIESGEENARHDTYRRAVEALYREKTIPLTMILKNDTARMQRLMPLYNASTTWIEFFRSIPKGDKCELLFNWMPAIIDRIIDDTYDGRKWYIDVRKMPQVKMKILKYMSKEQRGGSRTRRRRATRRMRLTLGLKGSAMTRWQRGLFSAVDDRELSGDE